MTPLSAAARAGLRTILSGNYSGQHWAIDSNSSDGNQSGVTIEYLTVEKYQPDGHSAAINPDSNTGWTIQYNTITLNVPGAGVILGADNVLKDNCLTLNGQYGFQSEDSDSWGVDSLTGGPTTSLSKATRSATTTPATIAGLLDNSAIGWSHLQPRACPVPELPLRPGHARRRPGRLQALADRTA